MVRRFLDDSRGSSVVEFALVCPVLITFILGALEVGTALRANAGLRDLAGWAGRQAVIARQQNPSAALVKTTVENDIRNRAASGRYNITATGLTVEATVAQHATVPGVDRVTIRLDYNHPVSIPFVTVKQIPISVVKTYFVSR